MAKINNPLPATRQGVCRYCRCTFYRSCEEGCDWFDAQGTVCDTADCVSRFTVALAKLCRAQSKRIAAVDGLIRQYISPEETSPMYEDFIDWLDDDEPKEARA